jgi:hypothetical protein
MSSSISNEVGGLLKDWLKNPLNASFVYWYFLPALGFVLLQLFVIYPALGYAAPEIVPDKDGLQSDSLVGLIVQLLRASVFWLMIMPLLIGVIMSSLSGSTLRLFRGTLPVMRILFRPWTRRNQKRSYEMFSDLIMLRRKYLFLSSSGVNLVTIDGEERGEHVKEEDLPELLDQVKLEIQGWHERHETSTFSPGSPMRGSSLSDASVLDGPPAERVLPMEAEKAGPNKLANILAVAEEYAFERYAMDASVFWPRISLEMDKEKLESLTTSYGAMRGLLNLSFLACLFALESLVIGEGLWQGWIHPAAQPSLRFRWLLIMAPLSLLVGLGAYRAAVGSARAVGNAMRTAFDYYRGSVLRRFNLKMPDEIDQERVVWLKLAAFIRRGESFYYPSDFRAE